MNKPKRSEKETEQGWQLSQDFRKQLLALVKRGGVKRTLLYGLTEISPRSAADYMAGKSAFRSNLVQFCEGLLKDLPRHLKTEVQAETVTLLKNFNSHITKVTNTAVEEIEPTKGEAWGHYHSWFDRKIKQPAFGMDLIGLSCSLLDLFIALRICSVKKIPDVLVRDPDEDIDPSQLLTYAVDALSWLTDEGFIQGSEVILQGHPGSGKSSLARVFVSQLLNSGKPALFIPLQRVDLSRIKEEQMTVETLCDLLDPAIQESGVSFRELIAAPKESITIVLDALDELQLLDGKNLTERFVSAYLDFARARGFKTLVTTRHQTISDIRYLLEDSQRFELLRYYYNYDTDKKYQNINVLEEQHDYRKDWWVKFGRITGKNWEGLPISLHDRAFEEFTCDPFNNLMSAIAYIDSPDGQTIHRIGDLYQRILKIVQQRGFDREAGARRKRVDTLSPELFEALLQDVALAAWRNSGRVTTLDNIKKACEESDHLLGYEEFIAPASHGQSNILLQFYFRNPNELSINRKQVEFTHKSFSDWLLVRKILEISKGWLKKKASFDDVIRLMSIGELKIEHVSLLHSEYDAWHTEELEHLQAVVNEHLSSISEVGFAVVIRAPENIFVPAYDQWEAEKAYSYIKRTVRSLFVISDVLRFEINSRAEGDDASKLLFDIKPDMFEFLVTPHRKDPLGASFRNISASDIDLSGKNLNWMLLDGEFIKVKFEAANLSETAMGNSYFLACDFSSAILKNSYLNNCMIEDCEFNDILSNKLDFSESELSQCNFTSSILMNASFEDARIESCKFIDSDLHGINLEGAQIDRETSFEGSFATAHLLNQTVILLDENQSTSLKELGWRRVGGRLTRS